MANFTQHIYDFQTIAGDTWSGVVFTITLNDQPLSLSGAIIAASFKNISTRITEQMFTIGDGLEIVDTDGVLMFGGVEMDMPHGRYNYDIQFDLATGERKTYIGGIATLTKDITP